VRLARALRVEVRKTVRSPAVAAYLLLAVLVAGFFGLNRYAVTKEAEQGRAAPVATDSFGDEEEPASPADAVPPGERGASGWLVLAGALRAGLFFSAVVLLLHGATLISGERTAGTLRLLLVRPVSRGDLLLAKALSLLLLAVLFVALTALTGWILGLTSGGYRAYIDVRYGMELRGHGTEELGRAALGTLLLAPLALFAVGSLGLFLSSILEGAAAAVIAATLAGVGIAVATFLLPETTGAWVFTTHVDRYATAFGDLAKGISGPGFDSRLLLPGLLVPAGTALVFLTAARIMFARREVHS
jgi:ABC-2 type transport system permease protein